MCVVFCRREGYVPSNYVKRVGQTMDGEEWFFPTLSRTRAEDILKEEVCVCVHVCAVCVCVHMCVRAIL